MLFITVTTKNQVMLYKFKWADIDNIVYVEKTGVLSMQILNKPSVNIETNPNQTIEEINGLIKNIVYHMIRNESLHIEFDL